MYYIKPFKILEMKYEFGEGKNTLMITAAILYRFSQELGTYLNI